MSVLPDGTTQGPCPVCHGKYACFPEGELGAPMHAPLGECELRAATALRESTVYDSDGITLLRGNVIDQLRRLQPDSVSCVVTSPPYWSLRRYDAPDVVWGGEAECEHEWSDVSKNGAVEGYAGAGRWQHGGHSRGDTPDDWTRVTQGSGLCVKCGAWAGQYGLEPTPELYVEHTLMWLREVRRVLRPDGVCWLNIGDGYAGSGQGWNSRLSVVPEHQSKEQWLAGPTADRTGRNGLKPKDLVMMPERVALAAQADGWWVRARVIWHKPNAMPESVRDRPTDDHEHIWMLTKSARYWYDQDAVRAPISENWKYGGGPPMPKDGPHVLTEGHRGHQVQRIYEEPKGRNLRTVWSFPTAQTPEAHFATFPDELPRRCIEASCPREICTACGRARTRIIERRGLDEHPARKDRSVRNKADYDGEDYERRESTRGLVADDVTVGWSDCGCDAPFTPGLVLDLFAGIGTTGLVARRLGRRFIGIELSEQYAEMAAKKFARWWEDTRLVTKAAPEGQEAMPL